MYVWNELKTSWDMKEQREKISISVIHYLLLVSFQPSLSFNIFTNDLKLDIKLPPVRKKKKKKAGRIMID